MRRYTIWTDGSCLGNPGYGGWGSIIFKSAFGMDYPTPAWFLCGSEMETTNNRMEMTAIISGLKHIEPNQSVRVITDSAYCADGATKWHFKWIEKQWKGVANVDLWHELLEAMKGHKKVEFKTIKGHSRIHWNEQCDELAKSAAKSRRDIDLTGDTTRYDELMMRIENGGGSFEDLAK